MKKRWISALLALALAAALLPGVAFAAPGDGQAGSRLTGADLAVYRVLKAEVAKIAGGARTGTVVHVPDQPALSWTLGELGAAGQNRNAALDRLEEKAADALHMERVYTALVSDCPYEMFWRGTGCTYESSQSLQGNRASIRNLTVTFQVAQAYQGSGETTVSAEKISAAKKAAQRAKDIVEEHSDESDYEKIVSYCREICRLASFDSAASQGDAPYGDPWQLVSVFDGDPATNVVCEGYSKAFQYLCDLSDFQGNVACRMVTGTMNGRGHMWNVVQMEDGQNYLVDVTNCDSGAVGAPDKLLLAGGTSPDGGRTHTISVGPYHTVYVYREEQENLYADGYLALSAGGYPYDPPPAQPGPAAFPDVPAWFETEVRWAAEQGITKGYGGGTTFAPGVECPHTQILTFLWRAEDKPAASAQAPFTVAPSYQDAVNWAYEKGMIDGSFEPDAPCTRAQAVWYIWQARDFPEAAGAASFSDVDGDAPYAGAVSWAVEKGVTKGSGSGGNTFAPDRVCTRGEIAAFLYRAYH